MHVRSVFAARRFTREQVRNMRKQQMYFDHGAKLNSNNTTQHVLVYTCAPTAGFKCFGACMFSCSCYAGLSARSPNVASVVQTPSTAFVFRVLPTHSSRRMRQTGLASHAHCIQTAHPVRRSAYASRVTEIRSRDVKRVRRVLSAIVQRTTLACVHHAAPTPFLQK